MRVPSLVVFLPDPVHVDQVGRAYCARRGAGHDDHEVALVVAAEGEQRVVDLREHLVRRVDRSTMNVSVPHDSASWQRTDSSGVNASNGSGECSRASRRTVSPDWVNATNAFASSRSPMSRAP